MTWMQPSVIYTPCDFCSQALILFLKHNRCTVSLRLRSFHFLSFTLSFLPFLFSVKPLSNLRARKQQITFNWRTQVQKKMFLSHQRLSFTLPFVYYLFFFLLWYVSMRAIASLLRITRFRQWFDLSIYSNSISSTTSVDTISFIVTLMSWSMCSGQ